MIQKLLIFILVCSFCQVSFSDESVYGLLMIVKGDVKIMKKDQSLVQAKIGAKIFPKETILTGKDSRAKIVMSDRNIINVLPETKLKIEQYVNSGEAKNVRLELLEGRVRNNVEQKYDNEKNKFEVKTVTAIAGVRGTQFITSFDKGSNKTEIITLKGEVSFRGLDAISNQATEPVIVKKGESSTTSDQGKTPEPPKKMAPADFNKIESETAVKKSNESPEAVAAVPTAGSVKSEIKQIISNIENNDNSISDTIKKNINKPAKVKVVPER